MSSNLKVPVGDLTHALEDYLVTIYGLIHEKGVARVRDICVLRRVKSGSASPAMNRLADMGLIEHHRGEFIILTSKGEDIARRIKARHDTLLWLFRDFLGVDADIAAADACALEHHLSDTSLDALVRMHEHASQFLSGLVRAAGPGPQAPHLHQESACRFCAPDVGQEHETQSSQSRLLATLEPGDHGVLDRIDADEQTRVRLLNLGFIPQANVEMNRIRKGGGFQVLLDGNQIEISAREASSIMIHAQGVV
jgi:DtxR family Mn-dependent transcriptional regulator